MWHGNKGIISPFFFFLFGKGSFIEKYVMSFTIECLNTLKKQRIRPSLVPLTKY
jgi:hypothetical protein